VGSELSYPSSPLYPYLIAPLYLLGGRAFFWAVYGAQAVVDAAHAVLLRRLGSSLFGPAAGWFAGIGWAGYGLAVFFTGDLMEATFAAFLATAGVACALGRADAGSERGGNPWPRALLGGLLLAAAALLRPHFLVVLPAAAAGCAWLARGGHRLRVAAAFCAGAGLLLGASLLRNAAISGEPILVSPYSGLNAYLGNHRGATGYLGFPAGKGLRNDLDLRQAAKAMPEALAGRALGEREVSAFWWRETLREIAASPAASLRLMGTKLRLFWSSQEAPNHLDFYFFREGSPALALAAVPFGLIGPISLVGIFLAAAGPLRSRRALVLCGVVAVYCAGACLFFIADRFRLPITGWLLLPAGGAAAYLLDSARSRRFAPAAAAAAAALLLGLALHVPARGPHGARERVMVAASLMGRGRAEEAETLLRRAVEVDPNSAAARFNLGRLLSAGGRDGEAEGELREAIRIAPDFWAAHEALGDLLAREAGGWTDESREELRRAAEIEPYGARAEEIRRKLAAAGP